MMDIRSQKITIDDTPYHLSTRFPADNNNSNNYSLVLTNGSDVFKGTLTHAEVNKMSQSADMDFSVYSTTLRKCLCGGGGGFTYQLKHDNNNNNNNNNNDNNTYKLTLKQNIDANVKFHLGSITMHKEHNNSSILVDMLNEYGRTITQNREEGVMLRDRVRRFVVTITRRPLLVKGFLFLY